MKKLKNKYSQKKKTPKSIPAVSKRNTRTIRLSSRGKYSSISSKFKRALIKPFVSLIKHYEIREDFLQIYKAHVDELYRNPRLRKRTSWSKKKWEQQISSFRKESLKVNPREFIAQFLDNFLKKFTLIKELLTRFLEWMGAIFLILFFLLHFNMLSIFDNLQILVSDWVIAPIIVIIAVVYGYKKWLMIDTEIFHMVNAKLTFNGLDIYRYKRYRRFNRNTVIAMAIWNKSLSNYSNFTIIFTMLCIKMVSKRLIYNYLFRALKELTPKYLEEYSRNPKDTTDMKKNMRAHWSEQFKIWWKEDHKTKNEESI
jgi:hypothetical protein